MGDDDSKRLSGQLAVNRSIRRPLHGARHRVINQRNFVVYRLFLPANHDERGCRFHSKKARKMLRKYARGRVEESPWKSLKKPWRAHNSLTKCKRRATECGKLNRWLGSKELPTRPILPVLLCAPQASERTKHLPTMRRGILALQRFPEAGDNRD